MESSLYEFGFHLHWNDLFKICAFFLPMMIWLISGCIEDHKWFRILIKALSVCLAVFVLWSLFILPVAQYQTIKKEIAQNKILVVEGEVVDFNTPQSAMGGHVIESFRIGDVFFVYSNTENYGYCQFFCNGGVISGNGQKLKIEYYTDPVTGERTICNIYEIQ